MRFLVPSAGIAENRAGLIESAAPCHDAQVVGSYRGSNPLQLNVLASKSEDYTALQHLREKYDQQSDVIFFQHIPWVDFKYQFKWETQNFTAPGKT